MPGSLIFKNRGKLSPKYVPDSLPHREKQTSLLFNLYMDALENIQEDYLLSSQLVGPLGTGKTVTALNFGLKFEAEARRRNVSLKHVYLNCKQDGSTRFVFFKNLVEKVEPKIASRSLSPEEMLHELLKYLRDEKMYIFIIVDEVGYFYTHSPKEQIIYNLTRLNEIYPGRLSHVLGLAFISRDTSFHKALEPSELSTLGRFTVQFPKYTAEQIRDILEERAVEAFKPGVLSSGVLDLISDVTVQPPFDGDLRVALDLLLYSGNLAENMGFEHVLPEHVREVCNETAPSITTEDIMDLDETGRLILLGIARSLERKSEAYVSLKEIREAYQIACEERGVKAEDEIDPYVEELVRLGIVSMKSLTKFTISDVPAEKLRRFLNGIVKRVEVGLEED